MVITLATALPDTVPNRPEVMQATFAGPPAVWPAIANRIMSTDLVNGPWSHTRSIIRHHAPGPAGAVVDVHATVIDRFERRGHRAVIDVLIEHDGRPIATLEHEAIVDLAGSAR